LSKATKPGWRDVKIRLADIDRAGLLSLIQDLYAADKSNQVFLHTRFGLGADEVLRPYRATLERWLWPDVYKNQDTSVVKAKKAIADYKKAAGQEDGLVELMVFYCEQAAGFADEVGLDDAGYYDALVRMFSNALEAMQSLPTAQCATLRVRLVRVAQVSHNFGYGVGDDMDELLDSSGESKAV
jgi:hypothetical protein